jgi:hypothetical protein
MATPIRTDDERVYLVVHPLYDEPEEKRTPDTLGPMRMTRSVRYSLLALRLYLILMVALAFYRVADLAGVFGRRMP